MKEKADLFMVSVEGMTLCMSYSGIRLGRRMGAKSRALREREAAGE
jgi:hypothetical protein